MSKAIITPPYIESPDNIRCGQSVTLMILKHFLPEKDWTFNEADRLCSYVEGKWTWSEAAALSLAQIGFEVVRYTDLDLEAFVEAPETYFFKKYGPEQGQETMDNIDLESSIDICKKYLANINIETIKRGWGLKDAARLLNEGYLLMAWVNPRLLYSRDKSDSGHMVMVFHYDEASKSILFHDPGYHSSALGGTQVNAWKSACIGIDHFMKAARAGGNDGSELTAFRLK